MASFCSMNLSYLCPKETLPPSARTPVRSAMGILACHECGSHNTQEAQQRPGRSSLFPPPPPRTFIPFTSDADRGSSCAHRLQDAQRRRLAEAPSDGAFQTRHLYPPRRTRERGGRGRQQHQNTPPLRDPPTHTDTPSRLGNISAVPSLWLGSKSWNSLP